MKICQYSLWTFCKQRLMGARKMGIKHKIGENKYNTIIRLLGSFHDKKYNIFCLAVPRAFSTTRKPITKRMLHWVLIHLSKGQLSKDHFFQGTLVQEDFYPRSQWSKETFVQGVSLKHHWLFMFFSIL